MGDRAGRGCLPLADRMLLVATDDGSELTGWKQDHNISDRRVRARVEHVFARMKRLADPSRLPPP
jgi:hypothetical protein